MLLKMFERALSASQSNCQVTTMFDTGSVSSQNSIAIVNESKTALTVLSITINWLVANDWLIFTFLLVPMWFNSDFLTVFQFVSAGTVSLRTQETSERD